MYLRRRYTTLLAWMRRQVMELDVPHDDNSHRNLLLVQIVFFYFILFSGQS